MQFKDVSLTPETISVTILSNTIQLCHFGPLMRFLRRCISMLDHQKSSDAAAVVSVTQKYQEFVPELDRWVHIESNPGLMESARPRQSRAIVEVAPPMEQPLLPVNARERPKRRLVPINSVLFNHELPVVTALPSEDQQQPSAPRKRALKLASNASSGVSQVSLVDVNSSEVMGMGLSTEDLHYLIHKKVFGNPQRTSVGSLQISRSFPSPWKNCRGIKKIK